MKRCPHCGQVFGVEYDYCLNDGTLLVDEFRVVVPTAFQIKDEPPTQVVSRQQTVVAPADGASVIPYLIIGVLAIVLIAVGMFALFIRGARKQPNGGGLSTFPQTSGSNTLTPTPALKTTEAAQPPADATPAGTPLPSPNGSFAGQLSYSTGSVFSARANLTTGDNGQVRGSIVWTLLRTSNPNKMDKVGHTATEFVQGTFDPATRTLSINGYSKSDAADLIVLDKYRLTMTMDGRRLEGNSYGSRNRGSFNLAR